MRNNSNIRMLFAKSIGTQINDDIIIKRTYFVDYFSTEIDLLKEFNLLSIFYIEFDHIIMEMFA